MTVSQIKRLVAQQTAAVSQVHGFELPKAGWLAELIIHLNIGVTTSAGAITIVDSTHGIIPLVTGIQLVLDGNKIPLGLSTNAGKFLDWWSHIDRPGSERLALSNTVTANPWDAVLRYPLAQSDANLTGALRMSQYGSARLEVTTGAISLIGSGTNIALTGTIDLYVTMYDENRALRVDNSVIHTLRNVLQDVPSVGVKQVKLPKGRLLERLILIPENNAVVGVWDILDSVTFRMGPGDEPYKLNTEVFRHEQMLNYGGDDIPIQGVYVFDLRRGDPNILLVPMGDPSLCPEPELEIVVSAGASLTNARVHVLLEELDRVGVAA